MFCFLVLSCHSCIPHGRPAPLGAAEVLRVAAGQAAAVAAVVQATLHFLSWLQPSILNVCPNNSSSRTSVLISGPRNLKCSSWFCATTVFIILILNEKSSCGLVFAQFLEEGEGCAGMRPFLLLEADLVIPGYWTGSRGPGVLQKMSGNGGGRVWSESKPDSDTPQPPPLC